MDKFIFISAFLLLAILIPISVMNSIERNKWLKEHCIKIGEVSGSTGFGVGISTNGSVVPTTTFIPGKNGYKCDDNMIYWE